ncbi:MAG: methyltransferase [Candidatus Absconditicoccaceae bacterium]
MKLKFNRDLSQQEIYATGPELAETMGHDRDDNGNRIYEYPHTKEQFVTVLENPVLMTDDYKFYNIKDYIARQTVQLLLRKPMTIVEYDGLRMEFEQGKYHGVRSPNIDTLLFCRAIKDLDYKDIKSVIEVGSGPGFIAKYIGTKSNDIEKIVMSDINENAKKYFDNSNIDSRAEFVLGDARKYLEGKYFDLIVCNPPYIPRPRAIEDNPYEGLELLIYLIKNFNKNLIINVSNLADDIINPILENCGAKIEQLDEMEVPLKVGNVLNNQERLDYLTQEKGLKNQYHDGHQYRQKIRILKLSK